MPLSPAEIAVAFSSQTYDEVEPYLAESIFWDLVAGRPRLDKGEVLVLLRETKQNLKVLTSTLLEQRVIDGGDTVVVDSVIEYVDSNSEKSVVSSCDIYEFEGGLVTHIRSYAGERSF